MLPRSDNERICRVGAGTPMGEVFRRYWLPVCVSTQIARPDSDPLRVSLLGERLAGRRLELTGRSVQAGQFHLQPRPLTAPQQGGSPTRPWPGCRKPRHRSRT